MESIKDKQWGRFLQTIDPSEEFPIQDEEHPTDPNRTLVRDTAQMM